jgi:hypothetical protein
MERGRGFYCNKATVFALYQCDRVLMRARARGQRLAFGLALGPIKPCDLIKRGVCHGLGAKARI